MRRIAVLVGLVLGFVWGGCDAPTFVCVADQGPANPAGCYCKADGHTCADWGDCITSCEAGE